MGVLIDHKPTSTIKEPLGEEDYIQGHDRPWQGGPRMFAMRCCSRPANVKAGSRLSGDLAMRTKVLYQWLTGIRLSHIGHRIAASRYSGRNIFFSTLVVFFTASVGTAVFSSISKYPNLVIATGIVSWLAAILSSVQASLGYSARSERHKAAACKYGMLRRELELFLDDSEQSQESLREFSKAFRERWDVVDQESPSLGESVHRKARRQLQRSLEAEGERFATPYMAQEMASKPAIA
jgi:hypothetical protein